MARKGLGPFGWFSFAGAVVMSVLYVLDATGTAKSILSRSNTLLVAMIAGLGTVLLWFGNDPTQEDEDEMALEELDEISPLG
jgi:hypothetical protein